MQTSQVERVNFNFRLSLNMQYDFSLNIEINAVAINF